VVILLERNNRLNDTKIPQLLDMTRVDWLSRTEWVVIRFYSPFLCNS